MANDFWTAYCAWRERYAAELAAENDETWQDPFADLRDRSPDGGRPPIDWTEVMSAEPAAPQA